MRQSVLAATRIAVIAGIVLAVCLPASAQPKPAARCLSVDGALLAPKAGGWEAVPAKSDIAADRLLISMFSAELSSPDDAVAVKLIADVGQRGPFASFETRVRFEPAKDADLGIALEAGILVLSNKKKAGPAKINLRVAGEIFELRLHDSKSRVGIEVHGRHLAGPANLKAAADDVPITTMMAFVLEGEAVITTTKHVRRMQAPPGPAFYLWDSVSQESEVQRFEKLPDFARPFDDKERKLFESMCVCAKRLADQPAEMKKHLHKALASADPTQRKTAVVALGAFDDTAGLLAALADPHRDVRDLAVVVTRAWLGRQPGQSLRWNEMLLKDGYTPIQAKNMLHLLNGIEQSKQRQPATFDILIHALNHAKTPTRQLAYWHLLRLVPGSDKITYDPTGTEAQRQQAVAEFRRLVPEGELPTPPKKTS